MTARSLTKRRAARRVKFTPDALDKLKPETNVYPVYATK